MGKLSLEKSKMFMCAINCLFGSGADLRGVGDNIKELRLNELVPVI